MGSKWKRQRPWRIFFKKLIILLLCVAIPMFALETVILHVVQKNVQNIVDTNNSNLLKQSLDSVESLLTDLDYFSLSIQENPAMINAIQAICNPAGGQDTAKAEKTVRDFLVPAMMAKPYIHSVYIYQENKNNRFVAGTDGGYDIAKYPDTGWYSYYFLNQKKRGGNFWSIRRLVKDTANNSGNLEIISLSKALKNPNGTIVMNVYKEYLDNRIKDLTFYQNQKLLILNENNDIIFTSHPRSPLLTSDINAIIGQNRSTIPEFVLNGEKCHVNIIHSDTVKWTYLSVIPHSSLYAVNNQLSVFINSMFILAMLICAILLIVNTFRSTEYLVHISRLLTAGRQRTEPPPRRKKTSNEYDWIVEDMLEVFIDQNNLNQQLTEKKHQAKVLEISALCSQISPHFLFNTLQSIFWMSYQLTGSHNQVCSMVENMSSILDYTLNDEETLIPIATEIKMAKNYMEIQQMRHKVGIECIWDYGDWIAPYHTIKLLLQPILENSVIHGMRHGNDRPLKIRVRIRQKENYLHIAVTDDGIGIRRDELQTIRRRLRSEHDEGHIGIYNCNRRLILMFGEDFGLSINSKVGLGTRVCIAIPKLTGSASSAAEDGK